MRDDILTPILARLIAIETGRAKLRTDLMARLDELQARLDAEAERIKRMVLLYGR